MDYIYWIFLIIIYGIFFMKILEMCATIKKKINIMEWIFYFNEYDLCRINNLSISIDLYSILVNNFNVIYFNLNCVCFLSIFILDNLIYLSTLLIFIT